MKWKLTTTNSVSVWISCFVYRAYMFTGSVLQEQSNNMCFKLSLFIFFDPCKQDNILCFSFISSEYLAFTCLQPFFIHPLCFLSKVASAFPSPPVLSCLPTPYHPHYPVGWTHTFGITCRQFVIRSTHITPYIPQSLCQLRKWQKLTGNKSLFNTLA